MKIVIFGLECGSFGGIAGQNIKLVITLLTFLKIFCCLTITKTIFIILNIFDNGNKVI
jgi:hypothetical protein